MIEDDGAPESDRNFFLIAAAIVGLVLIVALFAALPDTVTRQHPGTFTEPDGSLVVNCQHPEVWCDDEGR